jgi:ribosomal protein S18 acetylase RimI-like enzyme
MFQQSERAVFMVAEENGMLLGDGIALLRRHPTGVSARLYSLAVHGDQRGKGVGKLILEALIGHCVSQGAKRIHLQVERSNQSAIRLYERHDFQEVEILPDYYGAGRDGAHFVCDISKRLATADRPTLKPAA